MSELRVYDVSIDAYRPATQRDLDCFNILNQAYGAIRFAYNRDKRSPDLGLTLTAAVEEAHEKAMAAIEKLSAE